MTPHYLYKILSKSDWQQSQGKPFLKLSSMDDAFIHLATKEQLPAILKKLWPNDLDRVILKLDVSKLPGRLVKERNPGGTTEYYHLYDGALPLDAVSLESRDP
jgi:uncharacterized protein (DUF952 family)